MKAVFEALAHHAVMRPGDVAFADGETSITWAEFASRVAGAATVLRNGPRVVGLRLNGIPMVVADLAATLAGCRVVPVPWFFSPGQVQHLLADSGATLLEAVPVASGGTLDYPGGADRVIYTSGTTGRPKGVILGDRQLGAQIDALSRAIAPGPQDRYLSVLPLAQLLEQICGVYLPIVAGATCVISPEAGASIFTGVGRTLATVAAQVRPTVTVLAPRQLTLWVAAIRAGAPVPDSLRLVAVGGAPVSPRLVAEARELGLPVAEGYGLSEGCSVAALARPEGEGMIPLPGAIIRIEAGEIIIDGPAVMDGYLGRAPQDGAWHTGDMGRLQDGRLTVLGRRDGMILRASGRNIAPEWVEAEALADPAIPVAALVLTGEDRLVLVLGAARQPDLAAMQARLAALPAYARPDALLIVDPRSDGLIRPSGTADRRVAATLVANNPIALIDLTLPEIAA